MQEWQEKIEQEVGQLREEVRQLKEQRTDEMKAVRVNVASQDVIDRLDKLDQELEAHSKAWLDTLQKDYTEHKDAIDGVQTVLKGHAKYFEAHGKRLDATSTKEDVTRLETRLDTTATKDDIAAMATKEDLGQLRSEMATKNDIAAMKTDILDAMKQLLQQRPSE